MSRWHVNNTWGTPVALGTGYKTQLSLLAKTATLCPGYLDEMTIGPLSAPSGTEDNIVWEICLQTADDGTNEDLTPIYSGLSGATGSPPTGVTCRTTVQANYSAEPTVTATTRLWTKTMNMRGTFHWIASDLEAPVFWAAVNNAGLALRAKCAGNTPTVTWDSYFKDL